MQASSAISFRLPPASISAAASSGSPLLSSFRFLASLGPRFHDFYTASSRLSDLRCFRFLSSASVLDSDYSASVSSFPFSSRFCLTVASSVLRSHFRSFGFPRSLLPGFPCIPSRFWYSAFLFVSFRPSLIRSHSRSSGACLLLSLLALSGSLPLPFVRFCFPSGYSAFCFFLSLFFPFLPHSGFSGAQLPFRLAVFSLLSA